MNQGLKLKRKFLAMFCRNSHVFGRLFE